LFYGTGIPAAIILIDKENAQNRKAIFMVDAGKGFIKDGNKNRLREQDIRNMTDVFNGQIEIPGYSRMVSVSEIQENEYNLNIPRYIDSQEKEDIQDIEAHLLGGIPDRDIHELDHFWQVFPKLKTALFAKSDRKGFATVKIDKDQINQTIFAHPEFVAFSETMDTLFATWKKKTTTYLKKLALGHRPKEVIGLLAEDLLAQYADKPLVDKYNIYQHLLSYWNETTQDDCYIVAADGWKADTYRIMVENSKKKKVDKGWTCDLVPKDLVINHFFVAEKEAIEQLQTDKENTATQLTELEEEHSGEDGFFAELDKVSKVNVTRRIKELKGDTDAKAELAALNQYLTLYKQQADLNKKIKIAETTLDDLLYAKYPTLDEATVKKLVVENKWMQTVETAIKTEIDHISQRLTNRIKELTDRYDTPLPAIDQQVKDLEKKVSVHLKKMGFVWS